MKNLYCVYDKVTGVYNPPFVAENNETAVRSFNNAMQKHPFAADMALYALGTFGDDTDGVITAVQPSFICSFTAKAGE